MKTSFLGAAVVAASALSGCATVTQGSTDSVRVMTDPAGATCTLTRDGQVIGSVNPTPASVMVSKSRQDIEVNCERAGFLPADGVLSSEFEGATLGNVLLGGVIGLGVDAASGALNDYPPSVALTLIPTAFEDDLERDRFFRQRLSDLEESRERVAATIEQDCEANEDECERRLKKAEDAFAETLARLEADYRKVSPAPSGQLPTPET